MLKQNLARALRFRSLQRLGSRALILAASAAIFASPAQADNLQSEKLVCCGAAEVFIVDAADVTAKRWSWTASDSPSIPAEFRPKFRSTDDCKPYPDGLLLITSSSRGVALIQQETKRCLFLAEVANAHSACLLPDSQIAVAASTSGDEIQFFSRDDKQKPAAVKQRISLLGSHGVVWDGFRKSLWALGTEELLEIKYNGDPIDPAAWSVAARHRLPSEGGHDLSPAGDDTHLFVTTQTQVLRFNMNDTSFEVAEGFGDHLNVKSVDVHPVTKRVVFQQALPDEWWSNTISFADAPSVTMDSERLYKIRWDVPVPQP